MERLGDILKRTPINTSKADTGTSSAAEPESGLALSLTKGSDNSCPVCHGAGFVYQDVPSSDPDFGKAVPCSCIQSRFQAGQQTRLERYSHLGPLSRLTFDNLVPRGRRPDAASQERFARAVEAARRFAEQPEGWLVLLGPSGCGKTHLAAAIVQHRLSRGQSALFIVVPDLLDHLRSTFRPESDISYDELFQQVKAAPFLALDDLGSQATTPWAREKLFQIINHRYNERLPTVFTCALPLEEIEERLRTRLGDPELCRVFLLEDRAAPASRLGTGLEFLGLMTFDRFDLKRSELNAEQRENLAQAFQLAKGFAQDPKGWLVLQGVNGCGKTHLAAAIANYRVSQGQPALFVTVPELLDHLRAAFNPESPVSHDELFEQIKTAPLLIMDDFGEQTSTPWAQAKLYQLISYRYNAQLPTVFTTCLSLDEIEARGESRMTSRLGDVRLSTVFNIMAPDYRVEHPPRPVGASFRPPPRRPHPR